MKKAVFSIVFFLFLSSFLYGSIYFWIDENGVKHYTNIAPPLDETIEELEESRAVVQKLKSKENINQIFKVLKVFDGDTIQVTGLNLIFNIRLAGIDSPETGFNGQKGQPFSQKAKQHLADLLDNKNITIKSYGLGGYNRQLAEVFSDGKNINLEMIKTGLAEVYTGKPPRNFDLQVYLKEELKARRGRKGIWIQGASYKSPKQWRKENPRR